MKKTTTTAIVLAILTPLASIAQNPRIVGGHVACFTENLLDQFIDALVNEDARAREYLFQNGCFVPKQGLDVTILERSWPGRARVRVYLEDGTFEFWTNKENIR
jgi:hypothetical protein